MIELQVIPTNPLFGETPGWAWRVIHRETEVVLAAGWEYEQAQAWSEGTKVRRGWEYVHSR